jgi:hypothetical protein
MAAPCPRSLPHVSKGAARPYGVGSPGRGLQPALTTKFSMHTMRIWAMLLKYFPLNRLGGDSVDLLYGRQEGYVEIFPDNHEVASAGLSSYIESHESI